jgi:uncharacterized protein DUF5681
MSRKPKNGHFGAATHEESSVESAAVDAPGKTKSSSPLADYQFKPGQSGNPKGRPPTSDLKAEVRAFADEEDPKVRKTRLRQWFEMADRRARQGSPKHLELLLAYGWGRPSQAIELDANVSYHDVLVKAKERLKQHEREVLARLTAEEQETLRTLNSKMSTALLLPAATPTNGHSTPHDAILAASLPAQDLSTAREDDAPPIEEGRPAGTPRPGMRVRVEL